MARVFFFLLWPLFARAPRHWFLENFLLSAPGVQSCFFLLRSVGRRDLSAGPEQKKNTTQGVFFFCSGWCFFFCSGPVPARGFSFPCLSPGPEQKKNTLGGGFFLLRPRADAHSLTAGLGGDASPSPGWCFFFLLRPRPHRGGVFFLLWPRPGAHSLTVGWGDFGKARVVFFFLLRPRRVFLDNNKKMSGVLHRV